MRNGPPTHVGRRTFAAALVTGVASGCLRMDGDESGTEAPGATAGAGATTERSASDRPTTDPATESATATATEEPTATPEPTMDLPPGVAEDGVTTDLAGAHQEVVNELSYTIEHVHDFGGSRTTTTHRVDPTARRYRRERDQGTEQLSVFGAEGTKYARGEFEAGTFYGVATAGLSRSSLSFTPTVERILATGAYELTGTNPGATPKTAAIAAERVADPQPYAQLYPIESFRGLSGEGLVRESGLVESLSFDAVVVESTEGEEITFRKRVDTTSVGDTTVSRPDWVATAEERAPRLAAERADDDLLVLDHTGGHAVPTDTALFVATGDESYVGHTTIELTEGGTYYLYATGPDSDAGKGVQLRRDRPESGPHVSLGDSPRLQVGYLGVSFLFAEV